MMEPKKFVFRYFWSSIEVEDYDPNLGYPWILFACVCAQVNLTYHNHEFIRNTVIEYPMIIKHMATENPVVYSVLWFSHHITLFIYICINNVYVCVYAYVYQYMHMCIYIYIYMYMWKIFHIFDDREVIYMLSFIAYLQSKAHVRNKWLRMITTPQPISKIHDVAKATC